MRFRIRDFFENRDGWIFAVADYNHPNGIRCMLRYVPHPQGERQAEARKYHKLDFDEAFAFLKKERPGYVKDLHIVPENDVKNVFRPPKGLEIIAKTDARVDRLAMLFEDAGVPREEMGITGSMLLGLNTPKSDIDFVVYGPYWWEARKALSEAKKEGRIQDLDKTMWQRIYFKRNPETSFEEFVLHEKRKGNRGMIDGTYFDLLFTRDWRQIEPFSEGFPLGKSKIIAEVVKADFAFDSPAIFELKHNKIKEIYCYTHTYAGQALPGEEVEAVGVIEKTNNGFRLVVGTSREARGEWIRSLTLLKDKKKLSSSFKTI